jgi:hypothetical protein
VSCSATDESGNSDIGSFEVTVVDTTAPTITAPGPVTVEAKARDTLAVDVPLGSPETDDAVGVTSISNNAPASRLWTRRRRRSWRPPLSASKRRKSARRRT